MATRQNALKPEEPKILIEKNMMVIELHYDMHVVLPVSEGIAIIKALESAYKYVARYSKHTIIEPLNFDMSTKIISATDYKTARRNHLLGVNDETDE